MDFKQIVDTLISVGALALGATYLVGGLIVNLHLSRYGITRYQILKVKYLVVGLIYFVNFIAILVLSTIPAILLLGANALLQRITLIFSLLASILLLWLWGKSASPRLSRFSWPFWVVVGSVSSIFHLMVTIRLGLTLWLGGSINYELALLVGVACLAGVLSFVGQSYYYSKYLYGKPNPVFGSVDPIGMGIPVEAQLTGEECKISLLTHIGVPMLNPETTEKVWLLDETGTHYIIAISTSENSLRAVEVVKEIVKAIRYF